MFIIATGILNFEIKALGSKSSITKSLPSFHCTLYDGKLLDCGFYRSQFCNTTIGSKTKKNDF